MGGGVAKSQLHLPHHSEIGVSRTAHVTYAEYAKNQVVVGRLQTSREEPL